MQPHCTVRSPSDQLDSTAAIARQLEPFFGASATLLFSFGIFAAAFSSFLGNALVGGTVLADGLGLGSSIDEVWPKRLTVLALLVGMTIACYTTLSGNSAVNVIVLAQALTVLGVPAIAGPHALARMRRARSGTQDTSLDTDARRRRRCGDMCAGGANRDPPA